MKNKIISIILAITVIASFMVMAMGSNSSSSSSSSKVEATTEEHGYEKLSADTLISELDANIARTKNNYEGIYVDFSGVFNNVDDDAKYFTVETGDFSVISIFCYINSNESLKTTMFNYNEGDSVEILGKITSVEDGVFGPTVCITVESFI